MVFVDWSDRVVAKSAHALTRRRFLRNAGNAALGATLAATYLGTRPELAEACTFSNFCGPSPICGGFRCTGSVHQLCNTSRSDTKWRKHDQFVCGTAADINCWYSPCSGGVKYQCCDCAGNDTGGCGFITSGCGSGTWRSCICQSAALSC
jgi:hypothetical protein